MVVESHSDLTALESVPQLKPYPHPNKQPPIETGLNSSCLFCSRYITVLGVIGLLAQYVAVPFFAEKLKFHDSTISLMDAGTSCINQFILAFATAEYLVKQFVV